MSAMQERPPAVARQRVRRALRQFRERTPLSQGDVARELGWSLSKMQRIEAAEVAVSLTDLRALLDVYGVADAGLIADLSQEAQAARRQRWVTPPEHRDHLTAGLRQLMQFESEAVSIRAFQNVVLPGALQTPAVAELVLHMAGSRITDEARRVRFDVRMQRRRHLLDNPHGMEYLLILDESVIKRRVGSREVMAEQLEALAEIARRPNIAIRVVPFEMGARIGLVDPFSIVNLSDADDDAVVYREFYGDDRVIDDQVEVRYWREIFEEMWKTSLPEDATVRSIEAEAAQLRAEPDERRLS